MSLCLRYDHENNNNTFQLIDTNANQEPSFSKNSWFNYGGSGSIICIVFCPAQNLIASLSVSDKLVVWCATDQRKLWEKKVETGTNSVAFDDEGKYLIHGRDLERSPAPTCIVSDVRDGSILKELFPTSRGSFSCGVFSHDGTTAFVACDLDLQRAQEHVVMVWKIQEGGDTRVLHGHDYNIVSVCLSDDGAFLLTGDVFGNIRRWSTLNYQCINACGTEHKNAYDSFLFLGDGLRVISCSIYREVSLWDLTADPAGKTTLIPEWNHEGYSWGVCLVSGGRYLAVAEGNQKYVSIWSNGECVQRVCFSQPVLSITSRGDTIVVGFSSVDQHVMCKIVLDHSAIMQTFTIDEGEGSDQDGPRPSSFLLSLDYSLMIVSKGESAVIVFIDLNKI